MREEKNYCSIEGCTREVKYHKAQVCHPCYVALRYWKNKTVTEMVERSQRLAVFQARMEVVMPNVEVINQRVKKRTAGRGRR